MLIIATIASEKMSRSGMKSSIDLDAFFRHEYEDASLPMTALELKLLHP